MQFGQSYGSALFIELLSVRTVLNQRHPQNSSREQSRNRYNRNRSIQLIETQDQMELDLKNGEGAVSYPMEAQPKTKEGSDRH